MILGNGLSAQTEQDLQEVYDYYADEDIYNKNEIGLKLLVFYEKYNCTDDVFNKLYQFVAQYPNKQVHALVLALEDHIKANIANQSDLKINEFPKSLKAVNIALSQDDEMLRAKIFSTYGRTLVLQKKNSEALFYFKKVNSILEKHQHMAMYANNCFDVTSCTYLLSEYGHCIEMGKACLELPSISDHSNEMYRIYLLDLIGASYKNTGKPDSSIYYYKGLLDTLKSKPIEDRARNELWTSIAIGNLGENLLNLGKLYDAKPLIEDYYNYNLRNHDIYNIFLSTNLKARLLAAQGDRESAINLWKTVKNHPAADRKHDLIINAAEGLSKAYAGSGQIDSALLYQKIALDRKSLVKQTILISGLDATESKLNFEKLETSVKHSEEVIKKIKLSRTFAILSLIFLGLLIVALNLWNQSKLKFKLEEENLRRSMAEQEIEDSKKLLESMTQSLKEKSDLADVLNEQIENVINTENVESLKIQISNLSFLKDDDWDQFYHSFTKVYPGFIPKLEKDFFTLSPAEQRLAVLIKVGMTNTQISSTLGISTGSVAKSKYRLKQKLEMAGTEDMDLYIKSI